MTSDDLSAMEAKISGELSRRPECFITHPAEVRVLQQLDAAGLQEFAHQHGWRVVRRLGGSQLQFYNDTHARLAHDSV